MHGAIKVFLLFAGYKALKAYATAHEPEELKEVGVSIKIRRCQKRDTPDRLIFVFKKNGSYKVSFSILAGERYKVREKTPDDFSITITSAPEERVVEAYLLPQELIVTVESKGKKNEAYFP